MNPPISIAALVALRTITALPAGEVYQEPPVRSLLAELQLGTPQEQFLGCGQRFRDDNGLEAVANLEAGYKVTTRDQFELEPVKKVRPSFTRAPSNAFTHSTSASLPISPGSEGAAKLLSPDASIPKP